MELDEYINLEARVSGRMVLLDISATGEENVIEYDEKKQMNDLEYRRRQMEQLQDSVLDLEDMEGSVSITDMTLNDFRMDLSGFLKENLDQLERSPSGFHAVVSKGIDEAVPGMLEAAIESIVGKNEEKGIERLFSRGGTSLTQDHFSGLEDFEVVSYLIIKELAA